MAVGVHFSPCSFLLLLFLPPPFIVLVLHFLFGNTFQKLKTQSVKLRKENVLLPFLIRICSVPSLKSNHFYLFLTHPSRVFLSTSCNELFKPLKEKIAEYTWTIAFHVTVPVRYLSIPCHYTALSTPLPSALFSPNPMSLFIIFGTFTREI